MSSYTIYTNKDRLFDRVQEIFDEQGVSYETIDVEQAGFDREQIRDLLESLGMWAVDLVRTDAVEWQDSHLNEESDDQEIVEFIVENPMVIRTPIVRRHDGRAIYCDPPEQVFKMFG